MPVPRRTTPTYAPRSFVARCAGASLDDARGRFACTNGLADLPLGDGERSPSLLSVGGHLAGIPHYGNGRGTPDPSQDFIADPRRNTGMEAAVAGYLADKPLLHRGGSPTAAAAIAVACCRP